MGNLELDFGDIVVRVFEVDLLDGDGTGGGEVDAFTAERAKDRKRESVSGERRAASGERSRGKRSSRLVHHSKGPSSQLLLQLIIPVHQEDKSASLAADARARVRLAPSLERTSKDPH